MTNFAVYEGRGYPPPIAQDVNAHGAPDEPEVRLAQLGKSVEQVAHVQVQVCAPWKRLSTPHLLVIA